MSTSCTITPLRKALALLTLSPVVSPKAQGCPLSMTVVAFVFHPWARKMRSFQFIPRGLADDLTIYAIGAKHEERFKMGYQETLRYLIFIGTRPAPAKCYSCSTQSFNRFRLTHEYWGEISAYITVVHSIRDLGDHLYTSGRMNGATLTARLRRALVLCHRLSHFSWPWAAKQKVVQTLILPLGLYGCEAAPVANKLSAKLAVAIAKSIGP